MSVIVGLNLTSFTLIMGPTMLNFSGLILTKPLNTGSIITLVHAFTGGTALLAGIIIVFFWRFSKSLKSCARRRNTMLITIWLWGVSTFSGLIFYIYFYV